MAGISGFTFIHNGVDGGYPFVEAIQAVMPYVDEMVVVDMQSTDETRGVLEKLCVRILDGQWTPGGGDHSCLRFAHAMHVECKHDIIWHFEADEVFDDALADGLYRSIRIGIYGEGIIVHRIQVEQNFQRVRWYPEEVHRIFKRGNVKKAGHTTDLHNDLSVEYFSHVYQEYGLLWDVTNCFRDDWVQRVRNNTELHGGAEKYRAVGLHAIHGFNEVDVAQFLNQPLWRWKRSPFDLPSSLKELVGVTSYREHLKCQGLIS